MFFACSFPSIGCLSIALLLAGCSPKSAPEPIWIGHLAPLSGANQAQGEAEVQAMQRELETARASDWRVAGRSLGVRHVDGAEGRARAEAVRLLAVNRVPGLILGPGLKDAEEVAAVARTSEAVVVVLDEVAEVPAGGGIVLLGPDPARRGRALADLVEKVLKKKRVAVLLDDRDRVCTAVATAFMAAWREHGELRQWLVGDGPDRRVTPDEITKYRPEVVLAAVPISRLGSLPGAVLNVPLLYAGPDADADELVRPFTGLPGSEMFTATAFASTAPLSTVGKEWRQRYEKNQQPPPGRSAMLAADGLRLMMTVLERGQLSDPKKTREEAAKIKEFESVTGKVTWEDGKPVRPLFVVRARGQGGIGGNGDTG